MINDCLREAEEKMRRAVAALRDDLMTVRTGRASPALVERVRIDYYGTPTPLNQLANITAPEPRLLTIRPWDPGALAAIEKGILKSDLGLTPSNDGKVIRLPIPQLTEERRRELVRSVSHRVEEGHIAVRNIRRDTLKDMQDLEKEKLIAEDDLYRGKDRLQELTDKYVAEMDEIGRQKQAEIMEV
ncbi:MAG: ribosome recycling factor [Anaerolineae bacterium]